MGVDVDVQRSTAPPTYVKISDGFSGFFCSLVLASNVGSIFEVLSSTPSTAYVKITDVLCPQVCIKALYSIRELTMTKKQQKNSSRAKAPIQRSSATLSRSCSATQSRSVSVAPSHVVSNVSSRAVSNAPSRAASAAPSRVVSNAPSRVVSNVPSRAVSPDAHTDEQDADADSEGDRQSEDPDAELGMFRPSRLKSVLTIDQHDSNVAGGHRFTSSSSLMSRSRFTMAADAISSSAALVLAR
jgi:hypothetical protein